MVNSLISVIIINVNYMKILVTDECNVAWDESNDFFIYGGLLKRIMTKSCNP
jgi:hypothetical protein